MSWPNHAAIGERLITVAALVSLLGSALDAEGSGRSAPSAGTAAESLVVANTQDAGEGSLRQAILEADARPGPDTITFDSVLFHDPQTIKIESALPELSGELTIDGYIEKALWKANGVIVSGGGRFPVFHVGEGASLTLRHLTVADGCGQDGGGVLNLGKLLVRGVTFLDNGAFARGRCNRQPGRHRYGDQLHLRRQSGSGQWWRSGQPLRLGHRHELHVLRRTRPAKGGAIYNDGQLILRNTILANSPNGGDCVSERVARHCEHPLPDRRESWLRHTDQLRGSQSRAAGVL